MSSTLASAGSLAAMQDADHGAVQEFLRAAGLSKYSEVLAQHNLNTLEAVSRISNQDLDEMGITTIGARRKFLASASVLQTQLSSGSPVFPLSAEPAVTFALHTESKAPTAPAASPSTSSGGRGASAGEAPSTLALEQEIRARDLYIGELQQENTELQRQLQAALRLQGQKEAQIQILVDQMTTCKECAQSTAYHAVTTAEQEEVFAADGGGAATTSRGSSAGLAGEEEQAGAAAAAAAGKRASSVAPMGPEAVHKLLVTMANENSDLEVIVEAADQLLVYEREDMPKASANQTSNGEVLIRRRSMELDVDLLRRNISERVQVMNQKPKPPQYRLHKMRPMNYSEQILEQEKEMQKLDASAEAYRTFVDQCLEASRRHAETHLKFGEFRDPTERRLKARLSRLVGGKVVSAVATASTPAADNTGAAASPPGELTRTGSVTESFMLPRRLSKFGGVHDRLLAQMEELMKQIDTSGDGILQTAELSEAVARNRDLEVQLSVLAVNLALCPESRLQTDNAERNQLLQEVLDGVAELMDSDGDGLISLEELQAAPAEWKDKLRRLGVDVKF